MPGMLTQGSVDACTDNPDALLSHGKNFQFVDFTDPNNTGKDTRRLYFLEWATKPVGLSRRWSEGLQGRSGVGYGRGIPRSTGHHGA